LVKTLAEQRNKSFTAETGNEVLRGLREVGLLATATVALFFLISLITFNLDDPGWSHRGTGQPIVNAGGTVGAWVSDFFLAIFGLIAFLFPLMIAYQGYIVYAERRKRENNWVVALRWLGFGMTVISGASLAYIHVLRVRISLPETSGGILGEEMSTLLVNAFGITGTTLLLLAMLFAGITLTTGFSWIGLIDRIGKYTLIFSNYIYKLLWRCNRSFHSARLREPQSALNPRIAPKVPKPKLKVRKAPKIEPLSPAIELSDRVEKERQLPLFELPEQSLPPLSLLDQRPVQVQGFSKSYLDDMSRRVESILKDFGIDAEVVEVHPGPVITRFEIQPAAGIKVSRISSLDKDLARALSVRSVRIVEIIPGKSVIGLEIPNEERETVSLREILSSRVYEAAASPITLVLGKDISGKAVVADLAKMPHLLVAGTTGSGKSVAVNTMSLSMLYKSTPSEVRMIMIDPKMLELSVYEGIPHLLTPVVTDMKEAANALRWSVAEMERRYKLMSMLGVRNLGGFNRKILEAEKNGQPIKDPLFNPETPLQDGDEFPVLTTLPNIVIVIDELADMMMIVGKKVEQLIARLAQKARAAGLHLILATQRPSVDVLTGLIKANIPTRIAFQVSSKIDSRTVIDQAGAETLLGNGDMLYLPSGTSIPDRAHGAFVDDHEVHKVVDFLKSMGCANYIDEITREIDETAATGGFAESNDESDPLYDQAVRFVTESRRASISSVQRRLKVGYNRAARMIEDMESAGVVSSPETNGSREVLVPPPPEV